MEWTCVSCVCVGKIMKWQQLKEHNLFTSYTHSNTLYVKWFTHCHLHTIYQSDAMERTDVVNLHITKTIVCLGHFVSIVLKRDPKRSSWKVWPMAKLGVKNLILDIRTHAPREKQLIEHKILQLEVDGPLSRGTDTITSHKAQSWRCSLDLSHC